MTENKSERTLLAILALESEGGVSPEKDVHAFAAGSLPTLDTRVEMYLRAMHNGDAGTQNYTGAHDRILAAMATDLENDASHSGKGRGAAFLDTVTGFFNRARKASPSAFRRTAAFRSGLSIQRTGVFAAMTGVLLICGWSGAWFYALHSLNTTIAGWRLWEGKSGRQYSCASEGAGGYPFRVEMMCAGPKAAIVTGDGTFIVQAKELQFVAGVVSPSVIVSRIKGPVSVDELDRPDAFMGSWSHAQATVYGPHPTPDGFSLELADLKLEHVSHGVTEPIVSVEHVAFLARLNSAANQEPAYDLTAEIAGGIIPSGPPIASRPFAARMKAVLRGAGDMTAKPLPARIREWQRNGGLVEMTSVEVNGSSASANAQGTIALSASGGIDGTLELSGEEYDRLFEAFTGNNPASGKSDQLAATKTDGSRQVATRSLRGGDVASEPLHARNPGIPTQSSPETKLPNKSRRLPAIRFVDGAAYFGSILLGRLPPFF
ncbi:MAG TPA: DUF2125 domain-containing protein [Methylocella sp.]|nr:DUF2125 domain-containing protein [Methylocella sp.]